MGFGKSEGIISKVLVVTLIALSVALLLLSYSLYKARNWARIVTMCLSLTWVLALGTYGIIQTVTDYASFPECIFSIGMVVMLTTPAMVFTMILLHPHVRADFIHAPSSSSNEENA
jgi:hypothetical protein